MPLSKKTNDHLANERTFLAWVRTAIGIMGFGFVVVKFSMFVQQVSLMLGKPVNVRHSSYSPVIGVALVVIGAATALLAFINYRKIKKQIDEEAYSSAAPLITILTFSIVIVSALLVWYLIASTRV